MSKSADKEITKTEFANVLCLFTTIGLEELMNSPDADDSIKELFKSKSFKASTDYFKKRTLAKASTGVKKASLKNILSINNSSKTMIYNVMLNDLLFEINGHYNGEDTLEEFVDSLRDKEGCTLDVFYDTNLNMDVKVSPKLMQNTFLTTEIQKFRARIHKDVDSIWSDFKDMVDELIKKISVCMIDKIIIERNNTLSVYTLSYILKLHGDCDDGFAINMCGAYSDQLEKDNKKRLAAKEESKPGKVLSKKSSNGTKGSKVAAKSTKEPKKEPKKAPAKKVEKAKPTKPVDEEPKTDKVVKKKTDAPITPETKEDVEIEEKVDNDEEASDSTEESEVSDSEVSESDSDDK